MSKPLAYSAAALVALACSFAAGRFTAPTQVKTETETIYLTQTVHTRAVDRQVETKWRRVIVAKPDGSSVTTESSESVEKERSTETSKTEENGSKRDTKVVTADKNWHIGVVAGVNIENQWNVFQPTFGATVSRRLLGPIWGQAVILSDRTVAAGLALEF
jgi:hypothetical protein